MSEQDGEGVTDVADRTGISESTLSRLENGQRRPTLELLLALAAVYRIPLDDLVGAPETGDRRLRPKPRHVNGRTVLPLTQLGGVQAWKILVPERRPRRRRAATTVSSGFACCPDGYASSSVDRDLSLGVGDAVEFDTQVPHWFGSAGEGPVEVLSIFGRPGERVLLRGTDATAPNR